MSDEVTLRDQYAMSAVTGIIGDHNTKTMFFDSKTIAIKAYNIADAMMEARKVPANTPYDTGA